MSTVHQNSPNRQGSRLVAAICLLGLLVTGLGCWALVQTDRNTEERLLATQTRQAAMVLDAAVKAVQQPLIAGLEVQRSVLVERRRAVFVDRFARNVGADKPFVSASLWQTDAKSARRLASVGAGPGLEPTSRAAKALIRRAVRHDTSVVRRVAVGRGERIAYALADPDTGLVICAERPIPANRRAPVDRDSAFADLDYAIYFGRRPTQQSLTTTDVDPRNLPLQGTTSTASVPFGDTVLTLVTRPRRHLSSDLNQRMPWFVLVAGLLLTGATAAVSLQILRSRNRAESDTKTITALYEKVDALYGEQRDLAIGLQRGLLPRKIPHIAGLEVAAEYAAGAKGVDIGGDWYSVIGLGEEEFAFVVGDVSGHGVDAVAEMARARFTLRAYLLDGNPPHLALEKCSHQFDVATDEHMVTVIAGVGNVRTGTVTIANAGHPKPLLIAEDRTNEIVDTLLGPPLGIGATAYQSTTFTMPWNSTLLCFTDGLIERRGEDIDVGLRRLRDIIRRSERQQADGVKVFVTALLGQMRADDSADDVAILALKRVRP